MARQQVENGAQIIDVNMDEGMLEGEEAMVRFLDLVVAAEPDISRVPVMIDSSRWSIIEAGLKRVQGKAVVNSISLKEGEEEFVRQALLLKRYGAAVIVMAFDERGQADTKDRKVEVCKRAYRILTEDLRFPPEDIIFDPNVFAIATGIEEHDNYGVDFIEAVREISSTLTHSKTSGGISNVSFSFRGNNPVREAIHAGLPLPRHKGGPDDGHSERWPARRLRRDRRRPARDRRRHCPEPPPRLYRAPARPGGEVPRQGRRWNLTRRTWNGEAGPSRSGLSTRWSRA